MKSLLKAVADCFAINPLMTIIQIALALYGVSFIVARLI